MTVTMPEIIRRAVIHARTNGADLGMASRDGTNALTATGGSATTLADTAALPPAGTTTKWAQEWWIWLYNEGTADQRRIVESYAPSTNTLTHHGPDYSSTAISNLALSAPYMLLRDDPDVWQSAGYTALRERLAYIDYGLITTSTDQVTYQVTETSVTRRSQILDIEWAYATESAGEERWRPWHDGLRRWDAYTDGTTVVIDFIDPDHIPDSTQKIRVKYSREYSVTGSPWDVDLDWAAYATLTVMADWKRDPNNPEDHWNTLMRRAAESADSLRRRILGTDAYTTVKRPMVRTGIAGVGGRR